ncbi:hypothetical protein SLEP1_g53078 [Rubroshorea leprosula]|uniref:Reverse transcriptase domain-containing protein n=1 Tax=Rubroshorea leprosula TaxID=152421 RepID=A0AAV5M8E9_9ROSI|nr:hypothetical protein SLEP1_g53078 [Rubroshorea leprosula]
MEVDGFAGYKCKQKLKGLKEFLKGWNRDVFGDMEAQYEQAVKQIEQVDMKNEELDLEEFEILQRQEGFQKMWDIMRKKEVIWKQKSICDWVRVGDANMRFFHRVANGRKAQNHITSLMCDGGWVVEPTQVKKEAMNYFSKLFQEDKRSRPKPYGVNFKQISIEGNQWLERPFSTEEIEEALRSCEGSKAPGPDGYNFTFLKFAWNNLKEDFMSFFSEFNQNVVEEVKRKKQQAFVFKADFANAYDCVNWSFLEWMMDRMGFGTKWRRWIMECLSTSRISVLINGSPMEEFKVEKGLRQGDPLSPFLFLMIGEGLNGLVQKAVTEGLFRGVEIGMRGKSNIYGYNVPVSWVEGLAGMLRCGVGKSPFIYLGLPVDGNPLRKKLWEPLINKFRAKLAVWKAASLSFGGRLTLLNSGDKWRWKMEWRRERIGREKDEEEKLKEGLERIQLKKRVEDGWRWTHDSEGRYGVKNAYKFLTPTECVLDKQWSKLIWCKLVPSKVSFFGWRLCLDRLPTKWNIRKRGVPLQEEELKCVLCKDKVEEVNHLFSMCKEVWIFWVEVLQWWGMVTVMPNNVLSVADIFVNDLGRIIGKEMGACIFLVAAWYLWYWRNGEVFNNENNIRGRLMEMVQAKSFFWIKNKIHGCVFSFHEWKVKPVECALSVRKYKQMQKLFHKQQKGMGTA